MSRIIVAATPVSGHHGPLLRIASRLSGAGHQVVFLGGARFAGEVRAAGPEFRPLPAEADYDDRDFAARFPERARIPAGPALQVWDVMHVFGDPTAAQCRALKDTLAEFPATVVIHDNLFLGALALALGEEAAARPAVFSVGITPLIVESRDTAPPGSGLLPPADDAERERYAALVAHGEEQRKPLADHLRECFAAAGATLPEGPLGRVFTEAADVFVQLTVPGFEYPRGDQPANIRFAGIIPIPAGDGREHPSWWPELLRAREQGRRIVVATQGTLANDDLSRLVVPALRALADRDDVLVVAATGRPDAAARVAAALPELPGNAVVAGFVPFADLFPYTDVLITNGGYGGTQAALAHGVPLVVAGAGEDKPEVAARVEWTGTGVNLRTDTPGDEELRAAVGTVLGNPAHRERAARLARQYADHDALATFDTLVRTASAARRP
ncbi:nucleotide disphospho-sugar-binding domain-containing protein [Streptomyces sp. NPDC048717]|uniref:glycosyltransferase n=1 Tax=Streptomyces sp. NPDC048717 TaxID=3154928 RepID=UPI003436ED6C